MSFEQRKFEYVHLKFQVMSFEGDDPIIFVPGIIPKTEFAERLGCDPARVMWGWSSGYEELSSVSDLQHRCSFCHFPITYVDEDFLN